MTHVQDSFVAHRNASLLVIRSACYSSSPSQGLTVFCRPSLLPGALPHLTGLTVLEFTIQMDSTHSAAGLCSPDLFESLGNLRQLRRLHMSWPWPKSATCPPSAVSLTGFPVLPVLEEFRFHACLILDYAALRFVERQPALAPWHVHSLATTPDNMRRLHEAMPAHVTLEVAEVEQSRYHLLY